MRLRHRADRRTLLWALGFMPAVLALQCARPSLAAWLTPISVYLAYCAGVIAHNHNHCPTFRGRCANEAFSIWLSFFYGTATFAWIPTHNRNHHRFVNGPEDATRTWRVRRTNTAVSALTFFFVSAAAQQPLIAEFLRETRRRQPREHAWYVAQYAVLVVGHAAAFAIAVAWHGWLRGAIVYLTALGGPALLALWGLMFTNYVQHVDCDPASRWDHSRNFLSGWMNFLVFDNGFHTAHHLRPGLHWSQLRREHKRIAGMIDPRLNESSIFSYCLRTYWRPRFASAAGAIQSCSRTGLGRPRPGPPGPPSFPSARLPPDGRSLPSS